jgi:CRP-like cAMP-binding protein
LSTHTGAVADGVYILASGAAEAIIDGVTVTSNYSAGDFFGELALINDQLRLASVRATKSGTLPFSF